MSRTPSSVERDVITLYLCGLTVSETARQTGVYRTTVTRILDRHAIDRRDDGAGPWRRELCGNGLHRMDEWGEPHHQNSGRRCRACRLKAERDSARRRYWARRGVIGDQVPPGRGPRPTTLPKETP